MPTFQPLDSALQAEVNEAIRRSTIEVFETMLGIADVSTEILPLRLQKTGCRSGIFSLIGMTGAWEGATSLVCSGDFACKLSSRFLQTPFEVVDDEVLDAMAELTNMIGGNVKNILEHSLGAMSLGTPAVISGQDIRVHHIACVNAWTTLRFSCPDGDMYVHMRLDPIGAGRHTRTVEGIQVPVMLGHN